MHTTESLIGTPGTIPVWAMGFFLLAGVEAGVQVHQMGGFFPEKIERNLELPDGYHPVAVAAIGYTQETAEQESRTRKPVREIRIVK